jgi:hypothetical protein
MQQDLQTRSEQIVYSIEKSCAERLHGVGASQKVIAKLDFEEVKLELQKSKALMTNSELKNIVDVARLKNRVDVALLNKKETLVGPIEEYNLTTQKFFFATYCENLLYRVEEYKLANKKEDSRMKVDIADIRSSDTTPFKFEDQEYDMSSIMDFFFLRRMYKNRDKKISSSKLISYKYKEKTLTEKTYEWYTTMSEKKYKKKDNSKRETDRKVVKTQAETAKAESAAH